MRPCLLVAFLALALPLHAGPPPVTIAVRAEPGPDGFTISDSKQRDETATDLVYALRRRLSGRSCFRGCTSEWAVARPGELGDFVLLVMDRYVAALDPTSRNVCG
jgi:hypothetical protein